MKLKVLSLVLCAFVILFAAAPAVYANGDFVLTLDDEERYTNIAEVQDDNGQTYFDIEESQTAMNKKTYIVILSVLLVIAIGVLVFTLIKSKKLNADDGDEAVDETVDELKGGSETSSSDNKKNE